jgi:hypothetical protein
MIFLKIFKNTRALGNTVLILLLLGLFLPSMIRMLGQTQPVELSPRSDMPFYNLVFGSIYKVPVVSHLVTLLIMIFISYLLIRIGTRDQLVQQYSLMPAIFYILFTAALPEAHPVSPALIGSIFYVLCFHLLFELQDDPPNTLSIFRASLILVAGSMFYLKLIWFIPLIWLLLFTIRPVTWRELLYPVIGYFLLALFLFTWYWGIKGDAGEFTRLISDNMAIGGTFEEYHYSVYLLYGFFLLLVGIASLYMMGRFQSLKTDAQKIYQVLFYMFWGGILFYVFVARFDSAALAYIAFPVSFILSFYFHRKKVTWIHEVFIWILLGLVVYVQLMV